MGKMYGELYFYVSGLISRVAELRDDDYSVEVVKVAKQKLSAYSLDGWTMIDLEENLLSGFKKQGVSPSDDLQKLITFVLFAVDNETKVSYDHDVVFKLARVLYRSKVPVSRFPTYLASLCKREVVDKMRVLQSDEQYDECLAKIVGTVPYEDFEAGNLGEILRIVAEYTNRPYDPVFMGNYGIANVYYTLLCVMNSPKYAEYFDDKDIEKLDIVMRLMASVSEPEEYESLRKSVEKVVLENGDDFVMVSKSVLSYLDGYWNSLEDEEEIGGETEPEVPDNVIPFKH